MSSKKMGSWFLTERGKQFCMFAAGASSLTVICAHYFPQTFLLNVYKDFVHLYRNGITVPLSKNLQDRFQRALNLVGVADTEKHLYKPFHSYGFDIMSAGGDFSRFGVIVGIPSNFAYNSVDDVDKSRIKTPTNDDIIWSSEEGKNLQNSLVLSENAQLYAMAKEIKFRQKSKVMYDTLYASTSCLGIYGFSTFLNSKLNLYDRPRFLRFTSYTLISLFMFGVYVMFKDLTQLSFEQSVDKELKDANHIFAQGGKEYYTKILERNIALRKLLGSSGEAHFSVLGNENSFLRTKSLPLVQRKAFFEDAALA